MSHFFQLKCFCLLFKVSQLSDSFLLHVFDHIHIDNTRLVPIKAILLCEFFPSIFILATPVWMRWWSGGEQGGAQTSQKNLGWLPILETSLGRPSQHPLHHHFPARRCPCPSPRLQREEGDVSVGGAQGRGRRSGRRSRPPI